MQMYAVSYQETEGMVDGYLLEFFSRKAGACKRARELAEPGSPTLLFGVYKVQVPRKKADMIRFLGSVNNGIVLGEPVFWRAGGGR